MMDVGDRARFLVARGADPLAAADLSVPYAHFAKAAARKKLFSRAAALVVGGLLTALAGEAAGWARLTPAEQAQLAQIRAAGHADTVLPADLALRLALPPQDIRNTATILGLDEQGELDLAWQSTLDGHQPEPLGLPTRVDALRGLVAYLARTDPTSWPETLTAVRVDAGLIPAARELVGKLADVPPSDLHQLVPLLASILHLPADQRDALERAGYPPVPSDVEQREVYKLVGKAGREQVALIYGLLTDLSRQSALLRVDMLLRSPPVRRLLGAIADGVVVPGDQKGLPAACDISLPWSCRPSR